MFAQRLDERVTSESALERDRVEAPPETHDGSERDAVRLASAMGNAAYGRQLAEARPAQAGKGLARSPAVALRTEAPEGDRLIARELAQAVHLRHAPEQGLRVLARAPSTGTVVGSRGTEEIEGSEIKSEGGGFASEVRSTMTAVSTRLNVNAAHYGLQVKNACEQFRLYTSPKIKKLEDETTAAELASAIVGSTVGLIGGQLTGKIADEALKWIAEQVADFLKGQIEDSVKKKSGSGDSAEALKEVIDALVTGATDAATKAGSTAQTALDTRLTPIFEQLNTGARLSSEDDMLIAPFFRVAPAAMDRLIQSTFGIPAAASAQIAQLEIYGGLVEAFERKFIAATMSMAQSIEMADEEMRGDPNKSLKGHARKRGRYAANQRAAAMGVSIDQFVEAGRSFDQAEKAGMAGVSRAEYEKMVEEFEESQ